MAKRSPPMPLLSGSTTPSAALAAMAASMADPPRARICAPACEASVWLVATMPRPLMTIERACERSCACPGVYSISSANEARNRMLSGNDSSVGSSDGRRRLPTANPVLHELDLSTRLRQRVRPAIEKKLLYRPGGQRVDRWKHGSGGFGRPDALIAGGGWLFIMTTQLNDKNDNNESRSLGTAQQARRAPVHVLWYVAIGVALVAIMGLFIDAHQLAAQVSRLNDSTQAPIAKLSDQVAQSSTENAKRAELVAQEAHDTAASVELQARSEMRKSAATLSAKLAEQGQTERQTQQQVAGELENLKAADTDASSKLNAISGDVTSVKGDVTSVKGDVASTQ